ncbi:hypothetical protein E2C01_036142 [Portunus trituberculatus]|uniref:FZ domain-containing protein n=1 Tax=Portunus trituberculatus TaxID=210409 RepID=A0A5B7F4Z5_PORTR|nr:hypothetical protein [Portunus trituberculatus]
MKPLVAVILVVPLLITCVYEGNESQVYRLSLHCLLFITVPFDPRLPGSCVSKPPEVAGYGCKRFLPTCDDQTVSSLIISGYCKEIASTSQQIRGLKTERKQGRFLDSRTLLYNLDSYTYPAGVVSVFPSWHEHEADSHNISEGMMDGRAQLPASRE